MSDRTGRWVREPIIPSKEILANVLASGHDDFTAMEDIIDNAIEALSSVIGEANYKPEIKVKISDSSIEILDNGCGMSNSQARNAMRLGAHMVQGSIAGCTVPEEDHFLFGSGRLGHFGVGGKAGACKLGNLLEYTTRQKGDSEVTVVRFHPSGGEDKWEQEVMVREPAGEEIKLAHFTRVTISDLKCNTKNSFCYDSNDTTFFRIRARLFCTYFFLINRPGDKFDKEPDSEPPSHRNGMWTLKRALKTHCPHFQRAQPSFSFHLHINGSNILRPLKADESDDVEKNCPLNRILNCCYATMIDDSEIVRGENICDMYTVDTSTPPGPTPKAVAICMFDRFVDGKSSFEEQFEENMMSRLALLDIHNTNLDCVRADEAIERKNFRTFVFWRGRLLRHVDIHKTASNPKIPSFLQKRTKVGESYAPEGWASMRKEVTEATERVITFVFFNEAFRPDPAKTTLQKDVQPFQSIFETDLYSTRERIKHLQFLECIKYWKLHHDEEVKFEEVAEPSKANYVTDDEVFIALKLPLPNSFDKAEFFKRLVIRPSSAKVTKKGRSGKPSEITVGVGQWAIVSDGVGGNREILKVQQFIQLVDRRLKDEDTYWVRCFRPFAVIDSQIYHTVRASLVQSVATNSEIEELKSRVPEKFSVEIAYSDEVKKLHTLSNKSPPMASHPSRAALSEKIVAGNCPKLTIRLLNAKGTPPDIPCGPNQLIPYHLDLTLQCTGDGSEPKKSLLNCSPNGQQWVFDLGNPKDPIHKLFGKSGEIVVTFKAVVSSASIKISEEHSTLLKNAQVPFLKNLDDVSIIFKVDAAPPKKLQLQLEPCHQPRLRPSAREQFDIVCGQPFNILAAAVDEYSNILEGKFTKVNFFSKKIYWCSSGIEVSASDFDFQISPGSYHEQARCTRISRLVFKCLVPGDSHVNIDLGIEFTVNDLQLKLTGTLSKVRVLPGVPEKVRLSTAKLRPSEVMSSRFTRVDQQIVHEIDLFRNHCILDPKEGCDSLIIQAVDAWGNEIRDMKHYEVIIESSATESKQQTTFNLKGEAVIALASSCRGENKLFLADGSSMGIGWMNESVQHHDLRKIRRIWTGRSAAVGLATLENDRFWYSSYVHNFVSRSSRDQNVIGNLHVGMCCTFPRDSILEMDPRVKEFFYSKCLPSKPFPKPHHVVGRIVRIYSAIAEQDKVMFEVILFAPLENPPHYDGPKYRDSSYPYLAASNFSCVIHASDVFCYLHVVGVPSDPAALAHFNSTCTTKTGYNTDPVVPIGTFIVTHRLDSDLQLHKFGWRPEHPLRSSDGLISLRGLLTFKFYTPRHFSPCINMSLQAPVSDIKKQFLSELHSDISRFQSKQDGRSDTICRLPVYQNGDYLSLFDHSQLRFLCDGRTLPVNMDAPLYQFFGSSINREICVWVLGPEAAISYESCHAGEFSRFAYQDSITVWLKSVHLSNPNYDEQSQSDAKFPAKLPLASQESETDDPEHPSVLCSVIKLAVKPSLGPTDIQFLVSGIDDVEKRCYGREVGFVFPYDMNPTLILTFLNEFHEPTLADPALCVGILEIQRFYDNLSSFDGQDVVLPEPVVVQISGNSIEFQPSHQLYMSIVDSKRKSKLTFTLKLNRINSQIKSVLHLDTLEGTANNLVVTFDPKLSLLPGENDSYFVTAEHPLKLAISTMDQTGRPSQRGLGHIDEYGLKFSFLPVTKGKGKPTPLSNFFTNLKSTHLENEVHYFDVGEACNVSADLREFKFHISQLFLCGKPGKFVLKIRIFHLAGKKPELCLNMNLVIRPIENDCILMSNLPIDTVEGDLSEDSLKFYCAWFPKLFDKAPWIWNDGGNGAARYFVNNFSNGQITLHLNNFAISMNQESFEGQVNFKLVSGQTFLPNDQPTSVYSIERKQKQRTATYSLSFRPTSSGSRSGFRGALQEIFILSPPKVSHCVLLQWKTTADNWDAPAADSLQDKIICRYRAIQDVGLLQPQQEVLCFAGESIEMLLGAVSVDDFKEVFISNPHDYNIIVQIQKSRNVVATHDVDILTFDSLKLVSVKFSAPQGAVGTEYFCSLALSSRRARNSEYNLSIRLCHIIIVPSNGFLKFETSQSAMQLIPSSKPSFYDVHNMKIRLKAHISVHDSPYANSHLAWCVQGTTTMNSISVAKNGSTEFKLRNSFCDTEALKLSIGPVPPTTSKVRVTVYVQDVDQAVGVRKCCVDLIVPSSPSGQTTSASSGQHAASLDEAKRLVKQCTELQKVTFDEQTKIQTYQHLKHLEQSIKTVDFSSGDDASSLRQKVASINGCYVAGDTTKLLLPVYYLQRTIYDSIQQLPPSSKHLLKLPSDNELKHAGATLAWKLSELLQQDTFATVIIDAKHANSKMLPSQVYLAEQDAICNLARELGQMKCRYLPLCTIERVDENRRNLYEKFPLVPAEDHFITDHAKPKLFDRCQFKTLPCESVMDRPIGFLDWAVNFLHFDPNLAALKFRQKFWLPLLHNVAVFDRSLHAEEYKKYRENPDIGLPPITILTVFDDYFFHHDSASGISSYRHAPSLNSDELYKRDWGFRVAPAVDRLSFIRRELASAELVLESHKKRHRDQLEQLRALDPTGSLGWATEPLNRQQDSSRDRATWQQEGLAQPSKRTKFGESPGVFE